MNNQTIQTPSNPREVAELLGRILALAKDDRQALVSSWMRFDPGAFSDVVSMPTGSSEPLPTTEPRPSPEEVAQDVSRWVDSLSALPPEQRLLELEKALEQEDDEDIARQLQQAISALLGSNKMLAAKVALFRYAYEHPLLAFTGVLGLLATVVMIGKGVVVRIF